MKQSVLFRSGMKLAIIAFTSLTINNSASAQSQVAELMKAGTQDAGKLIGAYMAPTIKGFGAGLNSGWYNTAKPHGLGRFDITVSLNAAMVPDADKTFNAAALGFEKLTLVNPANNIGQTIAGSENVGTNNPVYELRMDDPNNPGSTIQVASFASPEGAELAYSGAPTAQLSVGLIKNTEVMVRYMPTIGAGDFDIGLFGFGVKHDIKQWIPVVNKLPFDMSAMFGYTKFNLNAGLDLNPEAGLPNHSSNTNTNYDDQELSLGTKATTFGLILSKKLSVLTLYGGVNYQTSTTEVRMKGNYPLTSLEANGSKAVDNFTDPVSFDVKGANGMNATVGARLKLLILTLHGSYTFAQYPIATVGVGINVDWK